jgi:hypothetical protein
MSNQTVTQKRKPVIHIGMPKTATKTLQWRLFSRHSEVYYLGRFDGPQFDQYLPHDCCRDNEVAKLMRQIAYQDIFNPDIAVCLELVRTINERAAVKNQIPVWSWESYATDVLGKRRVRARNLKRVFGDATILMALRNPLVLLESAYFQHLKRDNVSPQLGRGHKPYYRTIDQWLEDNFEGEVLPHLQYGETAQAYAEQFGAENVHIFLFEELLADEDRFFRRVCDAMQIDANEGTTLIQGERDNERWTNRQIQILQQIVQSKWKSRLFQLAPRSARLKWLDLCKFGTPKSDGQKATASIPLHWQRKIFEVAEPGNRWLETTLGLPLTKYGYTGD